VSFGPFDPVLVNLRPQQLAAHLERALAPVYTIHGDEPLLALEAGDAIRAAARKAGFEEREVLVAERGFPQLERRRGGTVAGSAWNAITSIILFGVLWLLSLPLWLTGIGALLLPALISALFNQRMFRYDALAEHASAAEYHAVLRASGGRLYALGLVLAAFYYVPVVNLLAPILSGLAFTHLCLAELARLRRGT